jgi:hypothetical protein
VAFANIGKHMQILSAALGIPAAAAGTYSAYQTYFSNTAICQQLRASVISTMEQSLPAEAKRALLRKDAGEFNTKCGGKDPDARSLFEAALKSDTPASAAVPGSRLADAGPGVSGGFADNVADGFGHSPSGQLSGWVALVRNDANGPGHLNFDGFALSLTSLPPAGVVLRARETLAVWRQPQRGPNDASQAQGAVVAGHCVRVLGTQPAQGSQRTWGEVTPVACPATLQSAN